MTDSDPQLPFDGPVLVESGAKASLPPDRLPDQLRTVQAYLGDRLDDYRLEYERVVDDDAREVFLVESDHWTRIGDRLELDRREIDAVRRAHETQLKRLGSATDRRAEFETALEVRDAVVVGVDHR